MNIEIPDSKIIDTAQSAAHDSFTHGKGSRLVQELAISELDSEDCRAIIRAAVVASIKELAPTIARDAVKELLRSEVKRLIKNERESLLI